MDINKKLIRNYLTIRYDPVSKPLIKQASWKDFKNNTSDPLGKITENLLLQSISDSLKKETGNIAVSLSSGIDSSLCLGLLRKAYPKRKIIAICGVFEGAFDESNVAKVTAEKFDADFKIVSMDSIFSNMPEIIHISQKPRWNTYTHLIAKEAKKFSKTLVTGDGADELYGGYVFRYDKFVKISQPNDHWKHKVMHYLECHNRDWVPDQAKLFGKTIKFNWDEIYFYFKSYFTNPLNQLKQVMLADFNGKLLYDFIPTGSAIYKHYKINGIPIFLYFPLIKFARHLPIEQKYNPKIQQGKIILRKIAKRLSINHIDEKRGFSPSLLFDWNKHGKDISQSFLLNKNSRIYEEKLINYEWVIKSFEKIQNDGDIRYLNRLISVLALEIWYRVFITKDMKSTQRLT